MTIDEFLAKEKEYCQGCYKEMVIECWCVKKDNEYYIAEYDDPQGEWVRREV